MKALIAILMLAMTSVASAAGFYVEGGLSAMHQIERREPMSLLVLEEHQQTDGRIYYWPTIYKIARMYPYDINEVRNPYGAVSIGYDMRWPRWSLDLQARHESSIVVGDRGRELVALNIRWYPFAR